MYVRTDSGLVLAEASADEAAISGYLKEVDPELELVRQVDPVFMMWSWRVNVRSPRGDVSLVCVWEDENRMPLPLSSALVEKVKSLRKDSRERQLDADVANELHRQRLRKDAEDRVQDVIDDHRKRAGRNRAPMFHKTDGYVASRRRWKRKGWDWT